VQTITAVQITAATFDDPHPNLEHIPGILYHTPTRAVFIPTPDGRAVGSIGDWIITGIDGQYCICRDDVFQASYVATSTPETSAIEKLPFNIVLMIATVLALRARGPTHLNALIHAYIGIDNDPTAFYSMMIMLYDRGLAVIDDNFIVSYVVPAVGSEQEQVMSEFEGLVPPSVLAAMS